MLGTRLVIGFAMVGALLLILYLDEWFAPWFPLWFILTLLVLETSALELVGLMNTGGVRSSGCSVFGGVIAVLIANWAPHLSHSLLASPHVAGPLSFDPLTPINALGWPLLVFVGVIMMTFLIQSTQFQKPGSTTATIAGTVLTVAYIGLLGSCIVQIRWFDGPYHGLLPLVYLVASAKGADIGGYTVGRIAGRHKLWPQLSPNKTVEGAIGGLIFGVAAAVLVTAVTRSFFAIPAFGWVHAIGFGLLVGLAAQLGDLMESMIKRDCSRKDASTTVPGFGGVLDVLDSLLFAGPVAYAYWLGLGP